MPTPLNATKKAPVRGPDNVQLRNTGASVVSSAPTVASVAFDGNGDWWATGLAAGPATLVATRTIDGATDDLDVEVIAAVPFTIGLGPEVPA